MLKSVSLLLLLLVALSAVSLFAGCATQTQLGGRQMGYSMSWANPHP